MTPVIGKGGIEGARRLTCSAEIARVRGRAPRDASPAWRGPVDLFDLRPLLHIEQPYGLLLEAEPPCQLGPGNPLLLRGFALRRLVQAHAAAFGQHDLLSSLTQA
jgi:hypothetical protein